MQIANCVACIICGIVVARKESCSNVIMKKSILRMIAMVLMLSFFVPIVSAAAAEAPVLTLYQYIEEAP